MACEHPIRLFISYSHDSAEHKARTLGLAQRLRLDGLECEIDQFVPGHPPEGWPRWMRRTLTGADFVIVVCTETYGRRFEGNEVPDRGLGATWESFLAIQEIYESGAKNRKYIPVVFEKADVDHVPAPLRAATYYHLPEQYEDLYRYLTGQPLVVPEPIGSIKRHLPLRSTTLEQSPVYAAPSSDSAVPQWLELRLRDTANPRSAIETLDVVIEAPGMDRIEKSALLLRKAILYQKIGKNKTCSELLNRYELTIPENVPRDTEFAICKGKLIAQLDGAPLPLQQYLQYLLTLPQFRSAEGEHRLSPLYWRMGLLWCRCDRAESSEALTRHLSTSTRGDYQWAHNQQCQAFSSLLTLPDPTGLARSRTFIERHLHEAFEQYTSLAHFAYRDKCIASNLAMLGVMHLRNKEPRRAYERLLHARIAFDHLQVRPYYEAMAEISGLLRTRFPEAYAIVFGLRLPELISKHAHGDLLRELFCDVVSYWAKVKDGTLSSLIPEVYASLVD